MERNELAADFFLIAHDEFTGKLRIARGRLGCGLVAAQLAQLLIAGRVALADNRVVLTDGAAPGANEVDVFVLDTVRRDMSVGSVREWTATLADPLYARVAHRLQAMGVVRREAGRRLTRRRTDRFPGADLLAAARPRTRLEHMIRHPRELDLPGAFTVALLWAVGAERVLDPDIARVAARQVAEQANEHLPVDLHTVLDGARMVLAGN